VGLIVLALRVSIPQSIIAVFEFAAGVLLVILGFLVVKPIVSTRIQGQKDNAQNQTNKHLHSDEGDSTRLTHLHQSAITGGLQGLGGSAALMLVTLTTVSSVELGLVFILLFGVGMIIGMMGVACLVSSVLTYTASRLKSVHDSIKAITGIASIVFGIFIIVQIL
jgi:cytochrome c biogenesis protein CcdA